jgi:hypothetical protein
VSINTSGIRASVLSELTDFRRGQVLTSPLVTRLSAIAGDSRASEDQLRAVLYAVVDSVFHYEYGESCVRDIDLVDNLARILPRS